MCKYALGILGDLYIIMRRQTLAVPRQRHQYTEAGVWS